MKGWMVLLGGVNLPIERGAAWAKPRKMDDRNLYLNQQSANEAAEQLAVKNPQVPVLILEVVSIMETGKPKIITKKVTPDGEVLI